MVEMIDRVCRHRTEAQMLNCSVCAFGTVKPKPARRRPNDTERLDALLRWIDASGHPEWIKFKHDWVYVLARRDIDRLIQEEARKL